ncbi:hypothetical protein FS749_009464 [Ceratobasidium sp. UAMH 11750]|nr:hypothetical protein FS749_009464 [Ceratobasidium sp. UAMH 11750]
MIYAFVKHLLRQGCYGTSTPNSGSIVVLSAYLGQIPKIHAKFKGEVTTVVDERDVDQLAERGLETDIATVERVELSKRVLIRTLDNFQGEEGGIIILSLARNSGTAFLKDVTSLEYNEGVRASVGFLKSINRTNVGLSRAKQGLYILGNAPELATASKMWATVLQELDSKDLVGSGFPIACSRHPDYVRFVQNPEMFAIHAPDGGCLQACNSRLPCGHTCPYKCHSDDPNHIAIKCQAPCPRLCPQQHPCRKLCFEACGKCGFPAQNVVLPCGHILKNATCHDSRHVGEVSCPTPVEKELPYCEHTAIMPCHQDPSTWTCRAPCTEPLNCCGRPCSSNCSRCVNISSPIPTRSERSPGKVARSSHPSHTCKKGLRCGHRCKDNCAKGHVCSGKCLEPCSQACSHHKCTKRCCDPCTPCMEQCAWVCDHQRCPMTCGTPCSRLPCDEPCRNTLKCGHPCLSLCGEPCDAQICRSCATESQLNSSADLYLGLTLKELGVGDGLDERTITLACRHTFTVETLDGVAELNKFYAQDANSKWTTTASPDLTGEVRPRPVCPTCRGPITSRRYGRVFKRADLDVLEHNVASTMSSKLFAAQTTLQESRGGIEARIISGVKTAKAMNPNQSPVASKKRQENASKERTVLLNRGGTGPTPPELLSESLSQAHLIDVQQQDAWAEAIEPILGAYIQACELFNKRSSHSVAYEGSFAALYRDEIAKSLASPSKMPREPEQLAMRLARMRIGDAPPPRTDKRFLLEAFYMTIEILLLLGRMAQRCSDLLSDRASDTKLWHDFAYFIFEHAQADAEKALTMAHDSESHRKVVSCSLLLLRAEIAIARFRLKDKIAAQEMTASLKAELQGEHAQTGESFKSRISKIKRDYRRHFGTVSTSGADEWLRENFGAHADALLKSWEEVKESIRLGTWYATVTNEEKLSIVKAFDFGHSGHFCRCPNGHPYIITECGGAMQESRCPECHAPIGGGSHRLRSDNTQDTELASLARGQGSGVNPWM